MRVVAFSALIAGIGAIIALVLYQGVGDVAAAIAAVGWGLVFVILSRLVPITLDGYVWRFLFPRDTMRPIALLLWARWIGEGVNTLMPAFQVGGALVRTRLLVFRGFQGKTVGASVVVDLTLSTLTQLLFTLVGVGLLLSHYGHNDIAKGAGAGVGLGLVLVIFFCFFQHRGLFSYLVGLVSRVAKGRDWVKAVGGAEALDEAIRALYRRRWALTFNAAGQMIAWTLGAVEIWLALYFMDIPVTIADALLLESLILAVRAAAFFVPGAVGVQEGAFVLLGAVIGIGPEVALALSLIKRVRELVIGAPALIAWQVAEGKHLFSRRPAAAAEKSLPQPVLERSNSD